MFENLDSIPSTRKQNESVESLLPHKVTFYQVLGIEMNIFGEEGILPAVTLGNAHWSGSA